MRRHIIKSWHRFYDPQIGRYLNADPIGLAGGINMFAYVGGDPFNRVDPWGLKLILPDNTDQKDLINSWIDEIERVASACKSKKGNEILKRLNKVRDPNTMDFIVKFSDIKWRAGQYETVQYSWEEKPTGIVELDFDLMNPNSTAFFYSVSQFGEDRKGYYGGIDTLAHELLGHGYDAANGIYENRQGAAISIANKVRDLINKPRRGGWFPCKNPCED